MVVPVIPVVSLRCFSSPFAPFPSPKLPSTRPTVLFARRRPASRPPLPSSLQPRHIFFFPSATSVLRTIHSPTFLRVILCCTCGLRPSFPASPPSFLLSLISSYPSPYLLRGPSIPLPQVTLLACPFPSFTHSLALFSRASSSRSSTVSVVSAGLQSVRRAHAGTAVSRPALGTRGRGWDACLVCVRDHSDPQARTHIGVPCRISPIPAVPATARSRMTFRIPYSPPRLSNRRLCTTHRPFACLRPLRDSQGHTHSYKIRRQLRRWSVQPPKFLEDDEEYQCCTGDGEVSPCSMQYGPAFGH